MKAIILNSGRGTRLYPLTRYKPKALVEIDSKPILAHQLDRIRQCGIKDVIMTTGFFENKIKTFVSNNFEDMDVVYVKNKLYRVTNYVYSLWLTRDIIDDDVILLHGDLFFDKELLAALIGNKHLNAVLVNKNIIPPDKDFKAVIENGKVVRLGVEFSGSNAFFAAPLFKFCRKDFLLWLNELGEWIKKGITHVYAETVFNSLSDKILLFPHYFESEVCLEIDNMVDLMQARQLIKKS